MGMQWQLVSKDVEDDEGIEEWLKKNFEPFAVSDGQVWLKQQAWTEDDEPQSSTKHENWAGKETTL